MTGGFYTGPGRHKHLHHCRKFYCMAIELWFSSSSSGGIVKTSNTSHALPQPTSEFLSRWVWDRLEDFHLWWFPRWCYSGSSRAPTLRTAALFTNHRSAWLEGPMCWSRVDGVKEELVDTAPWAKLPDGNWDQFSKSKHWWDSGVCFWICQKNPTPTQQNIPTPP